MTLRGSKQHTIKIKNRALVLQLILNKNITSRVDISKSINLTKTTLTNIVGELINDNIIENTNTPLNNSNLLGRKSIHLDLSPKAPLICGFLIQRNNLHIVLSDLKGDIFIDEKYSYKGLLSVDELKDILTSMYNKVSNSTEKEILAIGISCIGPINVIDGTMLNPHNFFDSPSIFNIVEFISNLSNLPTFLCNDATAGAIAEKLLGKGKDEGNFVYISTYKGIGAGLYLDHKLYTGETGQNGELGHMSINFLGPKCICGNNGCLELYVDIEKIIETFTSFKNIYPEHIAFTKDTISILDLFLLIDDADPLSMAVITEYCKYLSFAIANLITLLNINLVILAGSSEHNTNFFTSTLEHMINEHSLISEYKKIHVVESNFGLNSPLYGSVGIIMDKIFNGELYLDENKKIKQMGD